MPRHDDDPATREPPPPRAGPRAAGPSSAVDGSLVVRPARRGELAAAGAVAAAAYAADGLASGPYLERLADAAGRAGAAQVLVAVDASSGDVLGTATLALPPSPVCDIARPGEAEVRMLATASRSRGRGAGSALMDGCVAAARRAGAHTLVLSTQAAMTTAGRLYRRLGMVHVPERDWDVVTGAGEDLRLLVLELALDPDPDGSPAAPTGAVENR